MRLTKEQIYVGTKSGNSSVGAIVMGDESGPGLLYVGNSLADAADEWDERHGERVEWDDSGIEEYGGLEGAMGDAAIRVDSGGRAVWVNPHEWVRKFATVRDAGKFWRGDA